MSKQPKIKCENCGEIYNPNRYSVCPTCSTVVCNNYIHSKKTRISTPQELQALKKAGFGIRYRR